ncbi:hypothetical protein A6A04_20195 [Paramagnetospirillum marisnigri]|uniref:RepB-like DNA primase domain-containing protein n=2 Tax=Paramagnetospirillum marisnigri TaxID=1285242 RepID=A0A178MI66_9PROT|nr:hypothetical protein A6A04_20195 [Paramagnetospirillum marisnigri]
MVQRNIPPDINGKIVIAAYGQNPTTGEAIIPHVEHFAPGDVAGQANAIRRMGETPHANVYMSLAIMQPDLVRGKKGSEQDIIGLFALSVDFDDEDAENWQRRLLVPPSFTLETSKGRYQAFYVLDKMLGPKEAKQIATSLVQSADSDPCGKDVCHVWRIAGTMNRPNKKKVTEGRSPDPQLVRTVYENSDQPASTDLLKYIFPPVSLPEPKKTKRTERKLPDDVPNIPEMDNPASMPPTLMAMFAEPIQEGMRSEHIATSYFKARSAGYSTRQIGEAFLANPSGAASRFEGSEPRLWADMNRLKAKWDSDNDPARLFGDSATKKPVVVVRSTDPESTVSATVAAIAGAGRDIYSRSGVTVAVVTDPTTGTTSTRTVQKAHLIELACSAATFVQSKPGDDTKKVVPCSSQIAEMILARPNSGFPPLRGITPCPIIDLKTGIVTDKAGYDAASMLYLDTADLRMPPLPDPSRDAATTALGRLGGLFRTFPWRSDVDRSVCLAGAITGVIRPSLPKAPGFGFNAHVAGSGKTYVVDTQSVLASGAKCIPITYTDAAELEKRIGSQLIAGMPYIFIDNVSKPIGGDLLNQLFTSESLQQRELGVSVTHTVSTCVSFWATGNNLTVEGDLTRRILIATLDPGCERPELREFSSDPVADAHAHRGQYVADCLTIIRAYIAAGRPRQAVPLGSFEVWSDTVRSALMWLGMADPIAVLERSRDDDPELSSHAAVIDALRPVMMDSAFTTAEIIGLVQPKAYNPAINRDELREALLTVAGAGGAVNSLRLGRWLGSRKGRIVNGHRIIQAGSSHSAKRWKIEAV